jgi:hypothetical protein|eukprot:CAMPEP_0169156116 /NCGR_PEP_ID=MMETSP1015-20121227/53793_1 /TAXON_ID=342587 /ORGANISM="Karlodinium micrum, Strain CCMP2283" /LENGTH=526 /DNA_ID=CAMNT_0009226791 /DNA_START=51 /DNA_END=1631 /DNA_ORIENTATION=+
MSMDSKAFTHEVPTCSTLAEIDENDKITTSEEDSSSDDSEVKEHSGLRNRAAKAPTPTSSPAPMLAGPKNTWAARGKTVMAILCLWAFAPILAIVSLVAWLRFKVFGGCFEKGTSAAKKPLNILVTGGKMSKASAVARACGRDGHKVFTAEIMPYQLCHTRFCKYVSKHYILPRPTVRPQEWHAAIMSIVEEQNIDLIIPCTAPIESSAYAHLRESLPEHVRVFAFDGATSDELDNKYTFNQVLVKAGLPCPETAKMECLNDALDFFKKRESKPDDGKKFIVKPAVYDPKARTEILFLPIEDKQRQFEYLKSRNASKSVPYVIQEVLQEPEYGCYAIFNKGHLTGFEFFESAASCLVYSQLKKQYDQVMDLNAGIGKAMNLTGQLTLDLMHTPTGDLVPIECNPRIHSAVCTLEGHRNIGAMFTDPDFTPQSKTEIVKSKPTTYRYWLMDQVFLMLGFWKPKNCFKLSMSQMAKGGDAILSGDDPMPFLAMYLLQIPSLLVRELLAGTEWLKIDFCIGKIVKEGGD